MPEPNEPIEHQTQEEVHTDREAELEQQLSALRSELNEVKEQNRKMFLRLTGQEGQEEPEDPEEELEKRMCEVIRNRGRVPSV